MPDVTLRWVAASNADASTDYRIEADKVTPGTFATVVTRDATDRGDGSFTASSTTLTGTIPATDTSLTFMSITGFNAGDIVLIDREMIKLGTPANKTFNGCTRGIGGTIPATHADGSIIYKAHETYVDTNVNFGSRKVIRYRIKRVQGSDEAVGVELVMVNPPEPPFTNMCTVWGVLEDIWGTPQSGMPVKLTIDDEDNYGLDTGETVIKNQAETVTDEDGFFSFQVRRDVAPFTLSMDGLVWIVQNLPQEGNVNYLRT
ncbi:MAG TPA: hypothetical protein VF131_11095 [Blastocatellia bacterium]|nr:hypothetical protein [Blastocatellia bacterium]